MILGTGIDLVDINHFANLIASRESAFVSNHFCKTEQEYCESGFAGRTSHYAVRYAAKEAFIKALDQAYLFRTAPIQNINYLDIEVSRDSAGRPYLILHGAPKQTLETLQAKIFLSLSHDGAYAVAQVVLSCQNS